MHVFSFSSSMFIVKIIDWKWLFPFHFAMCILLGLTHLIIDNRELGNYGLSKLNLVVDVWSAKSLNTIKTCEMNGGPQWQTLNGTFAIHFINKISTLRFSSHTERTRIKRPLLGPEVFAHDSEQISQRRHLAQRRQWATTNNDKHFYLILCEFVRARVDIKDSSSPRLWMHCRGHEYMQIKCAPVAHAFAAHRI